MLAEVNNPWELFLSLRCRDVSAKDIVDKIHVDFLTVDLVTNQDWLSEEKLSTSYFCK
jgi:hypothetical protein